MAKTAQSVDRVPVFIPRGESKEDPNVVVTLNGKNYVLPKGQTSEVPVEVAEIIRASERAKKVEDDYVFRNAQ